MFDVAFDKRTFKSATGLVATDCSRDFLALKLVLHSNVPSLFAAEAYAGLQAVKLGRLLDLRSVVIKGYSRSVIKKCQSQEQDKSVIGAIISDIQNNTQAHKVAEESLRKEEETYQMRTNLDLPYVNLEGRWRRCPD
ncbi:hypothetical protein J1N35_031335 [Gossypium stocksii]|uniref:RNase H type-1 domain-containing protein n=1 Tax=Gossypium stocksii TaxID=47602 RepID=A0A9D3V196_9ROSI|nr:hypothetical protein J1N35_031335 [Gossypium stocksii]